jgi:hypothetical protein
MSLISFSLSRLPRLDHQDDIDSVFIALARSQWIERISNEGSAAELSKTDVM